MDQDGEGLLARVRELVAIVSTAGREAAIQTHLEAVLRSLGFEVARQPLASERWNLYARRGGSRFLVATHVDTVPRWGQKEGFRVRKRGDRLYGRGVLDAKGQIAAFLEASSKDRSLPACAAFFVDEERLGSGSEIFNWPWPDSFEGAVVLEPTGLAIATAQAGSLEVEVRLRGMRWHGATFRESDNAILRAVELIARIRSLPLWGSSDPRFGRLGINVGLIRAGLDVQIIPDHCTFRVDLPVLPDYGLDRVRDAVLKLLEEAGASYVVHHHEPPFETDPNAAVVQALLRAHTKVTGVAPRLTGFTAWTDAANLVRAGLPCVIYGAGDLALAHTPEESVALGELQALEEVLCEFLRTSTRPKREAEEGAVP
ncbi:MAG: M20/M25/M40 family metallo-hydrolase [candidate division KSB1 bacterium]|nr:M20/M25/M40 family metallo-hydrolase [candidate division KSB1 bacterium]